MHAFIVSYRVGRSKGEGGGAVGRVLRDVSTCRRAGWVADVAALVGLLVDVASLFGLLVDVPA